MKAKPFPVLLFWIGAALVVIGAFADDHSAVRLMDMALVLWAFAIFSSVEPDA
jgi:hypothetical protein